MESASGMNDATPYKAPESVGQEDATPLDQSLLRLEQALERIANRAVPAMPFHGAGEAHDVSAIVADRLDAMIARLRSALDEEGGRGPG